MFDGEEVCRVRKLEDLVAQWIAGFSSGPQRNDESVCVTEPRYPVLLGRSGSLFAVVGDVLLRRSSKALGRSFAPVKE